MENSSKYHVLTYPVQVSLSGWNILARLYLVLNSPKLNRRLLMRFRRVFPWHRPDSLFPSVKLFATDLFAPRARRERKSHTDADVKRRSTDARPCPSYVRKFHGSGPPNVFFLSFFRVLRLRPRLSQWKIHFTYSSKRTGNDEEECGVTHARSNEQSRVARMKIHEIMNNNVRSSRPLRPRSGQIRKRYELWNPFAHFLRKNLQISR